ncbi:13155_t:CDS:1, partial [Gigaspora rosea]
MNAYEEGESVKKRSGMEEKERIRYRGKRGWRQRATAKAQPQFSS